VGDGSTDDTVVINDALASGVGHVYVPNTAANIYCITSPLVIPSNTFLEIADGVQIKLNTSGSNLSNMLLNSTTAGTAGTLTSGSTPGTSTSGSAINFGITIDNDPVIRYVSLSSSLSSGAAIASAMQTAIQALAYGAGYAGATVTYGTTYKITSGTNGPCSNITVYPGLTNDVAATLKLTTATGAVIANGVAGNTNIRVKGGLWNFNSKSSGSGNSAHVMVFQNVSNLEIVNLQFENTFKYCMLVANCAQVRCDHPYFTTSVISDGFHVQGPCDGVYVTNCEGTTGDDMVSFTGGDYAAYQLSTGNMQNIYVDGLFGKNVAEFFRLVGSAPYYFTNVNLSNVYGNALDSHAIMIADDTNLTGTQVNGVTFKNIFCTCPGPSIQISSTMSPGITIRDMLIGNIESESTLRGLISVSAATPGSTTISVLKINNMKSYVQSASYPVYISGTGTVTINQLVIDGAAINLGSSYSIIDLITGTINELLINNSILSGANSIINAAAGTTVGDIIISNSYGSGLAYTCKLATNANLMVNNIKFPSLSSLIYLNANNLTVRVLAGMTEMGNTNLTQTGTTGSVTSLNGPGLPVKASLLATPQVGDMIYNYDSGSLSGVVLYFYNASSTWTKVA
jgi:hypothetical protein